MNLKKEEGISLMVLVITIIVMLILAGSTISMVFDKEGLLNNSKEIKEAQESDAQQRGEKTNELINDVDENIKDEYVDPSGANKPKLKSGMIPVKWDGSNWIVTDTKDSEWYNYNDKKWANIMLTDGLQVEGITDVTTANLEQMRGKKVTSLGSMFVWIPRYAYNIGSQYHNGGSGIAGTINITFLQGTSDTPIKNVNIVEYTETTTANYTKFPNGYVVHPAFNYGEEISGIWVAKFEASRNDATLTSVGSGSTIKVVPSVRSWRSINVSTIYTTCLNWTTGKNLNSHMMKNTEWGAVAYLTQSSYGKGSEIGVNQCYDYVTGFGPGGDGNITSSTYSYSSNTTKYSYTGVQGLKASSTGNITGIYDLSGGAFEYVAAYLDNSYVKASGTTGAATTNNRYTYVQTLVDSSNNKTKDIYAVSESGDTYSNNYTENQSKYGDAIWETSKSGTGYTSWNYDYSYFPYTYNPAIKRGGSYGSSSYAGLFYFYYLSGNTSSDTGFRPVLIAL